MPATGDRNRTSRHQQKLSPVEGFCRFQGLYYFTGGMNEGFKVVGKGSAQQTD
jgi:hypothetical protein